MDLKNQQKVRAGVRERCVLWKIKEERVRYGRLLNYDQCEESLKEQVMMVRKLKCVNDQRERREHLRGVE